MRAAVLVPMAVMLISGTCNTILMKSMTLQVLSPAPGMEPQSFYYPFFQTLIMLLGMLLCLGVHCGCGSSSPPTTLPRSWLVVPAAFDLTATTLIHSAYIAIPASVIQMCRGSIVLFTCALSVVFLGRRQSARQFLGVVLVTIGLLCVAVNAMLYGTQQSTFSVPSWVGVLLCFFGEAFIASKLVMEEKFFKSYTCNALEIVGYEGLFGAIMVVGLLIGLEYFRYERTSEALYMFHSSHFVKGACVAAAISIAIFNWAGTTVTQRASAVARSTIDVSRTVLVWAAELALGWNSFSGLQLLGFLVLTCGTLTYNGIVEPPCVPLDEEKALLEKDDGGA